MFPQNNSRKWNVKLGEVAVFTENKVLTQITQLMSFPVIVLLLSCGIRRF